MSTPFLIVAIIALTFVCIYLGKKNSDKDSKIQIMETSINTKTAQLIEANKHINELHRHNLKVDQELADLRNEQHPMSVERTIEYMYKGRICSFLIATGSLLITQTERERIEQRQERLIACRKEEGDIFADLDEGEE